MSFDIPVPAAVANDPNTDGPDFYIDAPPSVFEPQREEPAPQEPAARAEPEAPAVPDVEDMDDYFALLDNEQAAPEPDPEEPEEEAPPAAEEPEDDRSVEEILEAADAVEEKPSRENKRVRDLVARAAQAAATNRSLETMVTRLTEALEKQAAAQKWAQDQAQALEAQERAARERAEEDERIRALGYDPNDPNLKIIQSVLQRSTSVEQKLAAFEKAQQEQQAARERAEAQASVERYVAQMNGDVDRYLKGFEVAPQTKAAIEQAAFALAKAHQIANPATAAKEAIKMFAPALGKRKAVESKVAPATRQAAGLMSVRGATAGKRPGAHASGRAPKKDVLEIEREMFKHRRFG